MRLPDKPVLDNPVWHALAGPHRTFARGVGAARHYDPEVAPFAALSDDADPAAWPALRSLIGPRGVAVVVRAGVEPPAGWEALVRMTGVQMVQRDAPTAGDPDGRIQRLARRDVAEMLDLVARTGPGPFAPRTIELGTYLGVRRAGALVAMAGERMRGPGFTEVSAVCTDEHHRGRGLASALVTALVTAINQRGDAAILHALDDNVSAIRLYESLGFRVRRVMEFVVIRATPA